MKCANDGSFLTPRQLYALGMRLAQRYAPGSVTRAMISSLYEKTIPMESVAISRVMFMEELDRRRLELDRIREECDALIEKVPEPDERLILKLRYIKMCKWKEITDIMCLSSRMVLYKHGYAMKSFEAVNAEYLGRM